MCRKGCAHRKKLPTRMRIQRANGVTGAFRSSIRASEIQRPAAKITASSCGGTNSSWSYVQSLGFLSVRHLETALCDESGCPACGRKRLRLPVRDVAAPKTSPCPGSSGSGRQVCDARLHGSPLDARTNLAKDEQPAGSCGIVR